LLYMNIEMQQLFVKICTTLLPTDAGMDRGRERASDGAASVTEAGRLTATAS
jgi:hypothetical protein